MNGDNFDEGSFARFASESYSWKFIEKPALDRAIPGEMYTLSTRILDIGSGSGRVVDYHIQRGALQENIAGIDPSEENIQIARQLFPRVNFIIGRAQGIDFGVESFDVVTAQFSLRYFDNNELAALTSKVARALGSTGIFLMLDAHPVRCGISDGLKHYFREGRRTVATPWGGEETYFYRTLATYAQALINAGFHITKVDECPIVEAGVRPEYNADYAKYYYSPARFAMTAMKH